MIMVLENFNILLMKLTSRHLFAQSQQWEYRNYVWIKF